LLEQTANYLRLVPSQPEQLHAVESDELGLAVGE
jgi:hypothetical protein